MSTFLEKIEVFTRLRVEGQKQFLGFDELVLKTKDLNRKDSVLETVLARGSAPKVIAEIKRKSPSQGLLNDSIDPSTLARDYASAGASAISILTEPTSFGGSLADLNNVREMNPALVLLQKDFVIDAYQIYEALLLGADAVLLIVALLGEEKTRAYQALAHSLGLSTLVEVHTEEELQIALRIKARIIGINNRDLHSLKISLDASRKLIDLIPEDVIAVSESGINSSEEIRELFELGFDAFLIGSSFMRTTNPSEQLARILHEG